MLNIGSLQTGELSPVVESCTFERNWSRIQGGGMHNYDAYPTVTNCVFNANEAGAKRGGGMSNYNSGPEVTNCIFNANWALEQGGGIYHETSGGTIKNSTFYGNGRRTDTPAGPPPPGPWWLTLTRLAGAIFIFDGRGCTITNVIFDSNAAWEATGAVEDQTPDSVQVRTTLDSCLFHGNVIRTWTGSEWNEVPEDNYAPHALKTGLLFDSDPLFVNASDGDFHLRYDSPCIDAGYSFRHGNILGYWPMPATDFEGDKRIIDGDGDGVHAVDIGADEYKPE